MDRDAPFSYPPTPSPDVVPPVRWETARAVGLTGTGMVAGAAVLGLAATVIGDSTPWPLHTARLALVFLGTITAGLAVSFRPDRWQAWAIGVAAALLAIPGTPAHWDSFRLLFGVLAGVGAFRLAFAFASPRLRIAAISTLI